MKFLRPALKILALLIWTVIAVFLPQFFFSFLFSLFLDSSSASPLLTAIYSALTYSTSLALLIFVPWRFFKKWRTSREELGLTGLPTFVDLGLAPIGFAAYYLLAMLLTSLFELFPWFNLTESQDVGFDYLFSTTERIIAFVALVLIAPVAEELIFRGWLYGKLRAKLPKKLSVFLSILLVSLLFALLHGQWNVGINVFAMSVVLCLMREITGTIYSGIALHILKNGLAFFLVYILNVS